MTSSSTRRQAIEAQVQESLAMKTRFLADDLLQSNIDRVIDTLARCFAAGGKLLIAGNGGSAADAQHIASEFVCRYKLDRPGLPAIALTTDTSAMTAWANDYDYESYFARAVQALGKEGDCFLAISTSGNSKNVLRAIEAARQGKLTTFGLLGRDGGRMKPLVDIPLVIPHHDTPRIQEGHLLAIHIICEEVEKTLAPVLKT